MSLSQVEKKRTNPPNVQSNGVSRVVKLWNNPNKPYVQHPVQLGICIHLPQLGVSPHAAPPPLFPTSNGDQFAVNLLSIELGSTGQIWKFWRNCRRLSPSGTGVVKFRGREGPSWRIIRGLGYVVNNHGDCVRPLRIWLWDPFQMAELHGL